MPSTCLWSFSSPCRSGEPMTLHPTGQPSAFCIISALSELTSSPSLGSPRKLEAEWDLGYGTNGRYIFSTTFSSPSFMTFLFQVFPSLSFHVPVPPRYPPAP